MKKKYEECPNGKTEIHQHDGLFEIENNSLEQARNSEMLHQYHFDMENNMYYSYSKKGMRVELSNFVMQPLFHIKETSNSRRVYKITNTSKEEIYIEFTTSDLLSLRLFKKRLEGKGNYIWKGTAKDLQNLKRVIYEMESVQEIKRLGWQKQGFYAFGNGVLYDGQILYANEYGLVHIPDVDTFYLPCCSIINKDTNLYSNFESRFFYTGDSEISLRQYTNRLFEAFGNNGRIGFLFLLAA